MIIPVPIIIRQKSKEELDAEIEFSNNQHYLELKRNTNKELSELNIRLGTNMGLREAINNGHSLPSLCRKQLEELFNDPRLCTVCNVVTTDNKNKEGIVICGRCQYKVEGLL